MGKLLSFILIFFVISIIACQPAKEKVMEKKQVTIEKPAATGDAAVDAVGKDINNVDSIDKDLSADQLSNLDSGLSDVEKI